MEQLEQDRLQNRFYGVLFCIVSAFFFALSFYASTAWQTAGSVFVGGLIMTVGIWLIKTEKVYWSVSEGFTPKRKEQRNHV
ncbi:MAG: hypothetical protein CMK89_07670 [Pseudomonadales bacterium]|nr:hypothetical protein [Pseudomonadales bacterium]